jgi:ArsR family transcriptional regulator, arsenate/arsenite/antimonite-responsive transcriptional repressor
MLPVAPSGPATSNGSSKGRVNALGISSKLPSFSAGDHHGACSFGALLTAGAQANKVSAKQRISRPFGAEGRFDTGRVYRGRAPPALHGSLFFDSPDVKLRSSEGLRFYFDNIRSSEVSSKLERHAEQLGALGHPVRLSILRFVVQSGREGASAGEVQAHVRLPASTLSHHLKRLVVTGLVRTRGEGTFHYYAADFDALRTLTDYLWEDCCKRGKGCC